MTIETNQLEQQLAASFEAEARCCRQAIQLARGLPDVFQNGHDARTELLTLQTLLDEMDAIRRDGVAIRNEWSRRGCKPGKGAAEALGTLKQLLPELIEVTAQAEQAATNRRNLLRPELNSQVRTSRMLKAYGTAINAR